MIENLYRCAIGNPYRCVHCGKIVKRMSTKSWLKSHCAVTDKNVHLQLIQKRKPHETKSRKKGIGKRD